MSRTPMIEANAEADWVLWQVRCFEINITTSSMHTLVGH